MLLWREVKLRYMSFSEIIEPIIVSHEWFWTSKSLFFKRNSCRSTTCRVLPSGLVICTFHCSYNLDCDNYHRNWPYDRKNCSHEIEFDWNLDVQDTDFLENQREVYTHSEWMVAGFNSSAYKIIEQITNATSTKVRFDVEFERMCKLYDIFIITPALGMNIFFIEISQKSQTKHVIHFLVLMTLNLVSFMFNLTYNLRVILVIFNEAIHFAFLQQISWYIPSNGNELPSITQFFVLSTIITSVMIIEIFLLRQMRQWSYLNGTCIDAIIQLIQSIPRVGGFFTVNIEEMNTCMIDNEKMIGRKLSNNFDVENNCRESIELTHVLDRITAIIVTVTYIVKFFVLIPQSY